MKREIADHFGEVFEVLDAQLDYYNVKTYSFRQTAFDEIFTEIIKDPEPIKPEIQEPVDSNPPKTGVINSFTTLLKRTCFFWWYNRGFCLCPIFVIVIMSIYVIQIVVPVWTTPEKINFSDVSAIYSDVLPMQVTVNPYAINGVVGSKKNTNPFFQSYLGNPSTFTHSELPIDIYESNVTTIL